MLDGILPSVLIEHVKSYTYQVMNFTPLISNSPSIKFYILHGSSDGNKSINWSESITYLLECFYCNDNLLKLKSMRKRRRNYSTKFSCENASWKVGQCYVVNIEYHKTYGNNVWNFFSLIPNYYKTCNCESVREINRGCHLNFCPKTHNTLRHVVVNEDSKDYPNSPCYISGSHMTGIDKHGIEFSDPGNTYRSWYFPRNLESSMGKTIHSSEYNMS